MTELEWKLSEIDEFISHYKNKDPGRIKRFFEKEIDKFAYEITYEDKLFALKKLEKSKSVDIVNTNDTMDAIEKTRNIVLEKKNKIVGVVIFFSPEGAEKAGCYRLIKTKKYNYDVETAEFWLVYEDGKYLGINNLNCGYEGTGPWGTIDILGLLGVNFAEEDIFANRILYYIKSDGVWNLDFFSKEEDAVYWSGLGFFDNKKMREIKILKAVSDVLGLYDDCNFTLEEDVECTYRLNKEDSSWIVYLPEKGKRRDLEEFPSLYDACWHLIGKLVRPEYISETMQKFDQKILGM